MPDIRIKDLTTLAPSAVSDDYLAIDGTTNGTRKLSAFSPTFGGNATVGGTLTASGTGSHVFGTTNTVTLSSGAVTATGIVSTTAAAQRVVNTSGAFQIYKDATPSKAARFSFNTAVADAVSLGVYDGAAWADPLQVNTTQVLVTTTTASTSTSSGALVVGNGTSGGLGVGGAINAGGIIKGAQNVYVSAGLPAGINTTAFQVDVENATERNIVAFGDSSRAGLITGAHDGSGRATWKFGRYTTSFAEYVRITGVAATDAVLSIYGTTASTGTSSGALVVSGGVGVAKEMFLGIKLNISTHTGDAGGIGFGTETNLYRYQAGGLALDHASGAAPGFLFRENGTSTLRLETNSGVGYLSTLTSANLILRTNATTALTLDTSQNAIFAGTVRTAAPSGGTAASWKLGTVATVSPTSPNRTIEVDIGGTIYYIHAKTTNN